MPLAEVERDVRDHARTLTNLTEKIGDVMDDVTQLKEDRSVLAVENRYRDEKVGAIYKLLWLILSTVVVLLIGAVFAALKTGVFNVS